MESGVRVNGLEVRQDAAGRWERATREDRTVRRVHAPDRVELRRPADVTERFLGWDE